VRAATVGLDDHPLGGPCEVGADRGFTIGQDDPVVDFWLGEAGGAGEFEEAIFEFVPGWGAARVVLIENGAQASGATSRRVSLDLILERAQVEHLEDLRLVQGALDAAPVDHLGDVELCAWHRRAGDVLYPGRVGGARLARTPQPPPNPPPDPLPPRPAATAR
jgi:hypothetical protein